MFINIFPLFYYILLFLFPLSIFGVLFSRKATDLKKYLLFLIRGSIVLCSRFQQNPPNEKSVGDFKDLFSNFQNWVWEVIIRNKFCPKNNALAPLAMIVKINILTKIFHVSHSIASEIFIYFGLSIQNLIFLGISLIISFWWSAVKLLGWTIFVLSRGNLVRALNLAHFELFKNQNNWTKNWVTGFFRILHMNR